MKIQRFIPLLVLFIPLHIYAQGVQEGRFDSEFRIVKISPLDERVLIRLPDGRTQIIKVGDAIGDKGRVVEIIEDRVVIERVTDKDQETIVLRLQGKEQTVERYRKVGDGRRGSVMPMQIPEGFGRIP